MLARLDFEGRLERVGCLFECLRATLPFALGGKGGSEGALEGRANFRLLAGPRFEQSANLVGAGPQTLLQQPGARFVVGKRRDRGERHDAKLGAQILMKIWVEGHLLQGVMLGVSAVEGAFTFAGNEPQAEHFPGFLD